VGGSACYCQTLSWYNTEPAVAHGDFFATQLVYSFFFSLKPIKRNQYLDNPFKQSQLLQLSNGQKRLNKRADKVIVK
jgi:hypothetical protein